MTQREAGGSWLQPTFSLKCIKGIDASVLPIASEVHTTARVWADGRSDPRRSCRSSTSKRRSVRSSSRMVGVKARLLLLHTKSSIVVFGELCVLGFTQNQHKPNSLVRVGAVFKSLETAPARTSLSRDSEKCNSTQFTQKVRPFDHRNCIVSKRISHLQLRQNTKQKRKPGSTVCLNACWTDALV